MLNTDTLTLGEVAAIEDLSGQSIGVLQDEERPKGKLLAALAYVTRKRQIMAEGGDLSAWTFNDAMGLSIAEANELLGLNADEDAKPKAKRSRPTK